MSRSRWVISTLLAVHIAALMLASVPPPDRLPAVGPPRHPSEDVIAARLTPHVDAAAATLADVSAAIWRPVRSASRAATTYVEAVGQDERWLMFVRPSQSDEYLRVRYYVGTRTGAEDRPSWAAT